MKVQLETITSQKDCSFSMLYNPRLSDLFFWHFHPEYELVYIEAASGTRHVGDHISTYHDSDLVLIGSNIPHLNFDYGLKGEYRKVVVHLKKEFVEQHLSSIPELDSLATLFDTAKKGLAFDGETKKLVGDRLFALEHISPFEQYLQLVEVFKLLAEIDQTEILHKSQYVHKFRNKEHERLGLIYAFVDKNHHRKIEVSEVAETCSMTKEAFCRYFKKVTTYTFVEFLNRYRVSHSKRYLMAGDSVSTACYQSGFESLSYYNRIFKRITNENPSQFRKRYI